MSMSAQAKVLRVLQENKLTRVGGEKELSVDVRVIAATNKDLSQEILKGNFREDLYHRLSVLLIKVPPLASRLDDIPELAQHFMESALQEMGRPNIQFLPEAIDELQEAALELVIFES